MIAPFSENHVQEVCNVLADTAQGLTGSEIGVLLSDLGISDVQPMMTKRYRLHDAIMGEQQLRGNGECVRAVIEWVMEPVRYHSNQGLFDSRYSKLNTILSFSGYGIGRDGKVTDRPQASTLEDAEEKAVRLRRQLVSRGIHPDVLAACQAEYVVDNYFHAVLEATKSVAHKIRQVSGLTTDGSKLVDDAFGGSQPKVIINEFDTESRQSEQNGFMNLLKGMFSTFRNPIAHERKVDWVVDEQAALDLMSLSSFLHRKLDGAAPNTLGRRR